MPREYSRIDRIADLIQQELATLILREMQDPRLNLVTVTAVKVSKDLSFARVYITQPKPEAEVTETAKVLNRAANHLRFLLAHAVKLRVVPQLKFYYDSAIVSAANLSALIDKAVADDDKKQNK